ncbi:hypothetical protein M758_4G035200 [Ceratodon purpureus]|nr:hypothetical protein M758_4G035200 [Ceratodon purpureus]
MGFNLETGGSSSSRSSGYQSSSTDSTSQQYGLVGNHPYRCLSVLPDHEGHVFSIALATDQMLYSGSDCGELRASQWPSTEVIDALGATQNSQFGSGKGSVKAMVVVGNKVFTAHQDQKIRVWKRAGSSKRVTNISHKLVSTLPTVKDYVMTYITPKSSVQVRRHKKALWIDHHDTISVLAMGKGVLYSGSWDKTIKVWRISDLKCIESITAHIDAVNALAVDLSRGFLYSGSADGTVKVWERSRTPGLKSTTRHSAVATLAPSKNQSVNALALSQDGTICYAGSSDKGIAVWQTHDEGTGKHMINMGTLRGHRLAVLCLTSVSNLLVSGSADKTIRVWRRNPGEELNHQCLAVLQGHSRPVKCLAAVIEPLGEAMMVYSGSMDRSVRVWWLSLVDHDGESAGDAPSSPDVSAFLTPNESPFQELFQASLEPGFRARLQ